MKTLKEVSSKKNLEVKVTQLYRGLVENDSGEVYLLDFLRKDYPGGIREYTLQEIQCSGKNPEETRGIYHFFSCYNNEKARKHFEKYLPKKVLDFEFGAEKEEGSQNSPLWKEYDAGDP